MTDTTVGQGTRSVRIGNCSGFYGDRNDALAQMVGGGPVDVVTGDYLAEVTMYVLAKSRSRRPDEGYARSFLSQLEPVLSQVASRGIKIVVNAGGLNPAGMAAATRALCEKAGIGLQVAHIEGDDLLGDLAELQRRGIALNHMDTGEPLASWDKTPITANAYLGGWGIASALAEGADVVICPRVADASLVVGAAAWWHGWSMDAWDQLAGATVAGHIIECGAQASGGNFSGFVGLQDLYKPGFPIAEIDSDGTSRITKHPGTSGAVTVDTVTAQLLYEIQGPEYLNPDVTVHLDAVKLRSTAPDEVEVSGTRGEAPPETTKVAITAAGGFRNSATFALTGRNIPAKAALVEGTLRRRLMEEPGVEEMRFDLIGGEVANPPTQLAATSLLRVTVRGKESAVGRAFFDVVAEMGLSSYPGLYMFGSSPRAASAYGAYWPGLVPQSLVPQRIVWPDGSILDVDLPPTRSLAPSAQSRGEGAKGSWDGATTVRAPLGSIFQARSGDKGGNANVGIWTGDRDAFEWLCDYLTEDAFRDLVPEASGLSIDRCELPNLLAVNFVVKGLLDGGATETLAVDNQAKALGEYVLAKVVDMPSEILER